MTFDASINTTYGQALAQIRDKITGMANWSLKDSSYNTDSTALTANGDYYVITAPNGDDVRITMTNDGLTRLEHGPNWDAANSQWGDQYQQSHSAGPQQMSDYGSSNPSSQVRLWMQYTDGEGFCAYMSREEGDGSDKALAFGLAELTRLWDYTTAQVRESKYTAIFQGSPKNDHNNEMGRFNTVFEGGQSGGTYHGKGQVNADGNNDNFPMVETTLQASGRYEDAIIGSHNLWVRDNSGDRSAHLDTVTDGGTNEYKVFKEDIQTPFGMRMT